MKKGKDIDKEGLNEVINLSKKLLKVIYIIVIIGIFLCLIAVLKQLNLLSLLSGIVGVISPLFIGFVIAWLCYPLHKKFIDKGLNKILSAIIIFIIIITVVFSFIYVFIPILYNQVNDLISYIPSILSSTSNFVTKAFSRIDIKGIDIESIKQGLISTGQDYIVNVTSELPNNIVLLVKNIVSAFGIILISLVVGLYMLIDFDNLTVAFHNLLPKKNHEDYIKLIDNIGSNARKVVNGTLLVALMVFVCDTIGFALVGLNAAVLFGLLCGLTDLIPYIGPYIGGAAAVIVGFTQSPIVGLGVLIIAIIVQLLESYILQPVVMSKAMQLHPVVIIVGLLLFGYFFGIVGMVIATPCMAIIKEIIIFLRRKRTVGIDG